MHGSGADAAGFAFGTCPALRGLARKHSDRWLGAPMTFDYFLNSAGLIAVSSTRRRSDAVADGDGG